MVIQIQKAARKKARMRIEIASASGNWKTYSSLLLAKWLAWWDLSKVCMIDTENWSWHLYSNLWEYSVIEIEPAQASTQNILEAFKAAEDAWFEVIIFDSSSHWRDWILKQNEEETKKNYWNSFRAWWKTTPLYDRVIQHMLWSPAHVIMTARKKIDYALETNDQWKTVVKKVWMKDVQRDTAMYEFWVVFDLDQLHQATASKDRTWLFDWKEAFVITEETWKIMKDRCESWAEVKEEPKTETQKKEPAKSSDETLPQIENERFVKACEAIWQKKTTLEELTSRFSLTDDQKAIVKELFKVEL